LEKYREQNQQLNLQVAEVLENVASNISVELNSLDAGSSLTLDQEEAFIAIGDKSCQDIVFAGKTYVYPQNTSKEDVKEI